MATMTKCDRVVASEGASPPREEGSHVLKARSAATSTPVPGWACLEAELPETDFVARGESSRICLRNVDADRRLAPASEYVSTVDSSEIVERREVSKWPNAPPPVSPTR